LKRAGACLIASLAAIGAVLASPVGGSGEQASRIIDRTLVCRMSGIGYPDTVRFMGVGARQYQVVPERSWSIHAGNGSPAVPGAGAYVRTGSAGRGSQTPSGEVSLTRPESGRCARTRLRIPLSSRGLKTAPHERFDIGYRCDVPARVVIRVRAVFERPTVFSVSPRDTDVEEAKGDITSGYIAVTTLLRRKPIAFASVRGAREARIYVSPSRCKRTYP
jgi:hypothetical protein